MKNGLLYKLESLRGIAAVMVLIHHSALSVFDKELLFVKSAWMFVDFFFVLSGFVMSLAYKTKIQNGLSFKEYFLARFFRLFPLHIFVMFMFLPLIGAKYYLYNNGFGGTDPSLTENTYTFLTTFFLFNSLGFEGGWNFASWSISAEFVAYITFFWLLRLIPNKAFIAFVFSLSIIIFLASYLYFGVFTPFTWDFGFLRSVPAFLLGVVLYSVYEKLPVKQNHNLKELLAVLFLIFSVSMTTINSWFAYSAVLSFLYAVYVFSSDGDGFFGRLLNMKVPKLLGKYSYSIYMTHMFFIIILEDFIEHVLGVQLKSVDGLVAILVNLSLLIGVIIYSHYTYHYIEKPGRDFGKKYILNKNKSLTHV